MGQESYERTVRIGFKERDEAAAILQSAAADGRLTLEELDERLEAALQAKTYADLKPLLADLSPDLPQVGGSLVPTPVSLPQQPGYSREDQLMIDPGMGSEKRDGVWAMPPFIRIAQGMGSVKLNCLEARPLAPVIEIEVVGGAGSIVIVVPDGWAVQAERLARSWGTVKLKVPRDPAPGKPLLLLYGGVGMGSLKARPPSAGELRRVGRTQTN